MKRENYKTTLDRQDGFLVIEVPAVPGCSVLMDKTEAVFAKLN
jgi:hypothetical protein